MTDGYRGGYKKALLDMREILEKYGSDPYEGLKTKKRFLTFERDLLTLLLTDPYALDCFMENGYVDAHITQEGRIIR